MTREEGLKTLVPDVARASLGLVRDLFRTPFQRPASRFPADDCTDETVRRIRDSLFEKFCVVDDYANLYMSAYRGTFLTNFALGALAVLLGLTAHFAADADAGGWESALAGVEVVCVFTIAVLYYFSRHGLRWRDRAVDYRMLAEQLRHKTHLIGLGRLLPFTRVPAHYAATSPEQTWMSWYFRAVVREFGTPVEPWNPTGAPAPGARPGHVWSADFLRAVQADLGNWVESQRAYHENLHARYRWMHRTIQGWIWVLFACVILAALSHAWSWHWLGDVGVTLVCVVFPAVIGALHGIATQAELEGLAERSEAMARELKKERERLRAISISPPPPGDVPPGPADTAPPHEHLFTDTEAHASIMSSRQLGDRAASAARLMLEELYDWRIIYLRKDTEVT